jgi:hypothetical protein
MSDVNVVPKTAGAILSDSSNTYIKIVVCFSFLQFGNLSVTICTGNSLSQLRRKMLKISPYLINYQTMNEYKRVDI